MPSPYSGARLWPTLKQAARRMRSNATPAEAVLWQNLRRKQLGVIFRRQHAIGRFVVDFYCPSANLVIEVDGEIHRATGREDKVREQVLGEIGQHVMRFSNKRVLEETEQVVREIEGFVRLRRASPPP